MNESMWIWDNGVYTPSRCPQASDLGTIPWLQWNTIKVADIFKIFEGFLGQNFSAWQWNTPVPSEFVYSPSRNINTTQFDEACWATLGRVQWFCDLFTTGYYPYANVRNPTALPSPMEDVRRIVNITTLEWKNCGVPRGCIGVPPMP